jgi:hypothetical protein
MVVIDFGWDDGKVNVGIAKVNWYKDGEWRFLDKAISVQPVHPCRYFPSGWAVMVDGVYGWDAVYFVDNMNKAFREAGEYVVNVPRETRTKLLEMRSTFVGAA